MAPARTRRARQTEPWNILNNVNNSVTQKTPATASKAPQRRHTTHRANIYDVPVSPEPAGLPETPSRPLRSGLRSQNRPSTPEPSSSDDEENYTAQPEDDAQSDDSAGSSEDIDREDDEDKPAENRQSEELGSHGSFASLSRSYDDGDVNYANNNVPGSPSSTPSIPETPRLAPAQPRNKLPTEFFEQFEVQSDPEISDQHQAEGSPEIQELLDSQLVDSQFNEQHQTETNLDRAYRRELQEWFDQEMELLDLKNESRFLLQKSKWLRKQASRPKPDELSAAFAIISELRHIYKEILEIEYLSSDLKRDLRNLKDSLFLEFVRLRRYAMWETKDEPSAYLIDQFQAYIIPRIITLMLYGFKLYRMLGESANAQVQDTLLLLIQISLKIREAVESRYLVKEDDFANASDWTRPIYPPYETYIQLSAR
ncbi:uncharacterized protein N7477_009488 [Penicillium maclennaniae]|uniref:uncharacterized protein n=1 Tax=Penicillium maclennaniae TaxID=1343394 RepID=UPI00253F6EB4|nr:uncharacterized protein N7477_009488 [Penicillium maclennaniae]KAJ5661872.1 hypothetical protein N7477_009488 [Penicillium maclennaniae]